MRKSLISLISLVTLVSFCVNAKEESYTHSYSSCKGWTNEKLASSLEDADEYEWSTGAATTVAFLQFDISATSTYTCKATKHGSITKTGNLISEGGFEFEPGSAPTSKANSLGTTVNYQYLNMDASGVNIAAGATTTATNANNVKTAYFSKLAPVEGNRMLVCDGGNSESARIWQARNICSGTNPLKSGVTYQFSCSAANIDLQYTAHGTESLAKLKFVIEYDGSGGGKELLAFSVPEELGVWQEYKATFTPTKDLSWCNIWIVNYTTSFEGNDFALDDIYFGTEITSEDLIVTDTWNYTILSDPGLRFAAAGNCYGQNGLASAQTDIPCSITICDDAAMTNILKNADNVTSLDYEEPLYGNKTYYCKAVTSDGTCESSVIPFTATAHACSTGLPISIDVCEGEEYTITAPVEGTYLWDTGENTKSITRTTTTDEIVKCTITDAIGNVVNATFTVTVHKKPNATFAIDKYTRCPGACENITVTTSGNISHWHYMKVAKNAVTGLFTDTTGIDPLQPGVIWDQIETCAPAKVGESYRYLLEYGDKYCSTGKSNDVTVTAISCDDAIESDTVVCQGSDITLTAATTGTSYLWSTGETTQSVTITVNSDMTVTCTVSDGTNTTTETFNISIAARPSVKFDEIDYKICGGNFVDITANIKNATIASWYKVAKDEISGLYTDSTAITPIDPADISTARAYAPDNSGESFKYVVYVKNDLCDYVKSEDVTVTAKSCKVYKSKMQDLAICQNDTQKIEIRAIPDNADSYEWVIDGVTYNTQSVMVPVKDAEVTYTCESSLVDTIYTTKITVLTSNCEKTDKYIRCHDDCFEMEVIPSTVGHNLEYQWYRTSCSSPSTCEEVDQMIPEANKSRYTTCPVADSSIYSCHIKDLDNYGSMSVNNFVIILEQCVSRDTSIYHPVMCKDGEYTLHSTFENVEEAEFLWYDNTTEATNTVSPATPTSYTCMSYAPIGYGMIMLDSFYINIATPKVTPQENSYCLLEEIPIAASVDFATSPKPSWTVEWKSSGDGLSFVSTTLKSTTATSTEAGSYTVTALTKVDDNSICEATASVDVHPNPRIAQVVVDGPDAKVIVDGGTAPFKYTLTANGTTYDTCLIQNLEIGNYEVLVTDKYGCTATTTFDIVPVPLVIKPFFTPNADGNNDTWEIEGINYHPDAVIQIYDRYGRRLVVYNGRDKGWDGMYNGHLMPMDDYWYIITIEDLDKQFSGHFILKR